MRRMRTIIGGGLGGLLLLAFLVACGTTAQATKEPVVVATGTPSTAATVTPTAQGVTGPPASPIFSRPSDAPQLFPPSSGSPIIARPTGTVQLPLGGGPPTITPSANAVAPNSDGTCPATHPIKGAQLGPVKTYFVTDSAGYSTARASECFATEADAEAAGYRKVAR